MLRIMQNAEALHIGITAIDQCLKNAPDAPDTAAAALIRTKSELTEAKELLIQIKKAEETRIFEKCGSEAEEELYDIFSRLTEIHFDQGKVWALTVPMWKTIRNALYCRTGICLTKGVIVRRYYDFRCPDTAKDSSENGEENSKTAATARAVLDGFNSLYREVQNVRGGN